MAEARSAVDIATGHQAGGKNSREAVLARGYKVHLPPDKHIPISVSDLTDAARGSIRHEDRATFQEICQLIEGCATTEFASLRRRVKKNYRLFSAAAMHRDLPTRKGRGRAYQASATDLVRERQTLGKVRLL
jgi:hypothetical protein